MFATQRCHRFVALLATMNLCIPWNAMAVEPATTAVPVVESLRVVDVALGNGGTFAGQLLDSNGQAVTNLEVGLVSNGKLVALTTSNESGQFKMIGVRGGSYQLAAAGSQQPVRVWAEQTAPPTAGDSALLVVGSDVVRGQQGCGDGVGCGDSVGGRGGYRQNALARWMRANPGMVLVGVAAAIAIPIAIIAADDDDNS